MERDDALWQAGTVFAAPQQQSPHGGQEVKILLLSGGGEEGRDADMA